MTIIRLTIFILLLAAPSFMRAQSIVHSSDSISVQDSLKYERELTEVVVKAYRKDVKTTPRGLKISMAGNPISRLGSATDAIKQLPLIDTSKGSIEVMGYGTPLIYLNNKLVRNSTELSTLSADNIKDVEIVTNPSSKYGTDVTSVILIRTKKPNEGFHAIAAGNATQSEVFSASGDVNLNYHTEGGLTLFGDFSSSSAGYKQKRFYGETFYIPGQPDEIFHTRTHSGSRSRSCSLSADGGVNYDFGKNSVGVKYGFYRTPSSHYSDAGITQTDARADISEISSITNLATQSSMHTLNIFGDLTLPRDINLRLDADYLSSSKTSASSVDENQSWQWVRNLNRTLSHLWAAKIVASRKIRNTELEVGSDLSFTSNKQDFTSASSANTSFLLPGIDDVKQKLYALFGSFDWTPYPKWNIYGGLRWESTDSRYRHDNLLNPDLSRRYGNILPNAGISFSSRIHATLFYRASVSRPGYQSLDKNFIYVTPSLWETGNPQLQSTLTHRFGLTLSYMKFTLQSSFAVNKRRISAVYYYDVDKDVNVTMPVNLPRFNSFQIVAVQQLDLDFWHPTFQGVLYVQHLKYGIPHRSYGKPLYTLSVNNRFNLPGGIYAYLSIYGLGTGNQDVLYSHGSWQASLTLNKSWRNWTFTLSANDLFGTWSQPFDTATNTVTYTSNRKGASQSVSLSVRYTLNAAKGRYKGKTARQDEIDRL